MTELTIPRYFTTENTHPFDAVAWEVRDAVIAGKDGTPVFEAHGVEFPDFWSQRATDIVASKYFRVVNGKRETSVKQMIHRVSDTIAAWGVLDSYFSQEMSRTFHQELTSILLNQYASFNSPVWFNVGVQERPYTSACYILDVEDSMESILEWYRQEGMIFKGGSGSGVNLSKIRPKGSPLSNGGTASGPMSFARVADANAGAIKSGGSTRRAAKLLMLDVDHSEIEDFIQCKVDAERLARKLMELGYSNGIEGGAYDQVPWQNANNSVSVPDTFMNAATQGHRDCIGLYNRHWSADILYKIARAAWECGDPGLFFKDTINAWHTTPSRDSIVSSNPCGEFLRPPNEACNLASLNLLKFLKDDGSFDIPAFTHTVDIMITAMDIMIDRSSYPADTIGQNSRDYRPLGLGYCNLGALLMTNGLPYDSDEGRVLAASITALLAGEAYSQSGRVAQVKGAFAGFLQNQKAMQDVLAKHADALIGKLGLLHPIAVQAVEAWDMAYSCSGAGVGLRNCQVTVLAPCGTISFMMDADTTGIEPCLGLVTTKKLVGGGEMQIANRAIVRAGHTLGYDNPTAIAYYLEHPEENDNTPWYMMEKHRDVFACALSGSTGAALTWDSITWQGHIKMVAAVQPFISGGISKTINMPHDATVEDVHDAYIMAWKLGLKAISIYRDGSKGVQPVTIESIQGKTLSDAARNNVLILPVPAFEEKTAAREQGNYRPHSLPQRHRLPDERRSITHKFAINTHEGYLTVGLYENGSPGELFVRMSKEGSTLGGLMDAWATVMSIALQYGVPLSVLIAKFTDGQYEPRGFTSNPEIRITTSITDYIARWLELKFGQVGAVLVQQDAAITPLVSGVFSVPVSKDARSGVSSALPFCSECGNMTMRNGSCCVCTVCGTTTGCS